MNIKILWFDNLKGIGEGQDSKGNIIFLNSYYHAFSKLFPKVGDKLTIRLHHETS